MGGRLATSKVRLDYLTPTYIYYYIEPPPQRFFNLIKQYVSSISHIVVYHRTIGDRAIV